MQQAPTYSGRDTRAPKFQLTLYAREDTAPALERIAAQLGYVRHNERPRDRGSISQLIRAIAEGELLVTKAH
jgi:hypothetical protein